MYIEKSRNLPQTGRSSTPETNIAMSIVLESLSAASRNNWKSINTTSFQTSSVDAKLISTSTKLAS